eukprot:TRINITY_DN2562_c0_g1_i1.p1 TRINITY_DN2562_c0_g1~~TRINITY_DN2562_c0_g1_i1.p1  ORF type:complete len:460 (-),score=49.48 TRINITY_DN2562_c0_g1_i1:364-1743(-)
MEPPTIAWICQVVLLSTGAPILYILYVWLYPKLRRSYVTRRVTIPGPTPDPFSGNIGDVIAFGGLHEAMRKWSEEYGEVYRMWMGFEPFIVITDPVLTKQVLMSSSYRGPVVDRLERVWGGHNLFTLQPPVWNQHAKLLRPAFSVHVIKDLVPIFSRYSLKMMECWERDGLVTPLSALASESDNSHSHRASEHTPSGNVIEFNVIEWLTRMSLDIIGVTSFGHNFRCLDGDGGEIMAAFDTMLQATVDSFSETVPWYQVWETAKEEKRRRALGVLFNAVKTVLNEKRKGQAEPQASSEADDDHHAKSDNLMDILMATTDEDTSRGLTDEQIQCEVMAFLTGHDTTAGTLTFLLYCLAINPDVQRKVQTEIDAQFERCFAEGRTSLSWDDLKRLTYTHAAIKVIDARLLPTDTHCFTSLTRPARFTDRRRVSDCIPSLLLFNVVWLKIWNLAGIGSPLGR